MLWMEYPRSAHVGDLSCPRTAVAGLSSDRNDEPVVSGGK